MSVEIEIKNLPQVYQELMERRPRLFKASLADAMDHASRSFLKTFYKERLQGRPGIKAQHKGIFHRFRRITVVNGKAVFLSQSATQKGSTRAIQGSAKDPMNMTIEIYSKSRVSEIHEKGGTISSAKAMPIPLNATARMISRNPGAMNGLQVVPINGKLFLAKKNIFGKMELLFILKRGIRIQPRLGFYQTWGEHDSRRTQIITDSLNDALAKG